MKTNLEGDENDVVAEEGGLRVLRKDIRTLEGINWINDAVVDFSLHLIQKRSHQQKKLPKVKSLSTFFLASMRSADDLSHFVQRFSRRENLFESDITIIPICEKVRI